MTTSSRTARGATLLEAMIAMAILTVGMLGLMQLHVLGFRSNSGARANTFASQLARELVAGLETLPFDDGHLGFTSQFGPLLKDDGTVLAATAYDDTAQVPGVRSDASLERDPEDRAHPLFRRRWTVKDVGPTASGSAVRMVAVSVIWRERGVSRPREVVLYVAKANPGLALANAAAYR